MNNKTIKKISATAMSAVMLFSAQNFYLNASAEYINYRSSSNYFASVLPSTNQTITDSKIYSNILTSLQSYDTDYSNSSEYTPAITIGKSTADNSSIVNRYEKILTLVITDHPEFFWIDGEPNIYSSGIKQVISFKVRSAYQNGSSRQTAKEKINSAVTTYVQGALEYNSPYERALYLHDTLAKNISYNSTGALEENQGIDTAFINKKTVCAGYARAYSYLCNAVGIDAISVESVGHEWNMIKVGAYWYCVDVTHDDLSTLSHKYFLCDYTTFQNGETNNYHVTSTEDYSTYISYLPSCTATDSGSSALKWGDLNGDSKINSDDATLISNPSSLNAQQQAVADLDCDRDVDSDDAKILDDYLVGALNFLPALSYPPTTIVNLNFPCSNITGDVNGDSTINSKDAVYILIDYARTLTGRDSSLNSSVSDVNKDGKINAVDAVKVLQYYATKLTNSSLGTMEDFLNG